MSLGDPIGDMLTRIRNGQMRSLNKIEVPFSNFRSKILEVLKREGYIISYEIKTNENKIMMIDKEIYRGPSPRDSVIMKMAKNEIEIDEVIEAREFLDALEKARENGYKGSDKDFAKEYYRDALNEGGSPDKTFKPSPDDLLDTFYKTMEFRSKLTPEELKVIDELVDKSLNRKKWKSN